MRLLKKLAIFIVPFIILFLLFFIFEPYDYFCVKGDAIYLSRPLSSMREVRKNKPGNIIFGDSQMANLNVEYIEEITGEDYSTLAFGGASLRENLDLFQYATENTELKKVVFGVSFYSLGKYGEDSRIPNVLEQVNNPFKFVANFNYWLEALNTVKYKTVNAAADVLGKPELKSYPENPTLFDAPQDIPSERGTVYRKNLEDYAETICEQFPQGYSIKPEVYTELQKLIDYCDENGIELIFVFPPMHQSISTNVIEPLSIEKDIEEAKEFLKSRATVYDFEYVNAFTENEDNFYDGFHLANAQKKFFAEMLFVSPDPNYVQIFEK